MQITKSYPNQNDELKSVITLELFIEKELLQKASPFFEDSFVMNFIRGRLVACARQLSKYLGRPLLIENIDKEIFTFNRPLRNVLKKLLLEKKIINWECQVIILDTVRFYKCFIKSADIFTEENILICRAGSMDGSSMHADINTSLTIALAEFTERWDSIRWSELLLQKSSISTLKKNNQYFFDNSYLSDTALYDETKELGWVVARDLTLHKSILLPANLVYIFYPPLHPNEPFFGEVTSSGVAAHVKKQDAQLAAIYELIERDAFLMYWLNSITPKQIDVDTIENKNVQEMITSLKNRDFSFHLLDFKTELAVPVLVLIVIDNVRGGVCVNASSGLDIGLVVEKVFADALKWDYHHVPEKYSGEYVDISTLSQRASLWYGGEMKHYIDFMICGKKKTYMEYIKEYDNLPLKTEAMQYVQNILSKHHMSVICFDYTHGLGSQIGLSVVRVCIPELMPMYFQEHMANLNVPRLYTFPKVMGFADIESSSNTINKVPHPFI